MATPHLDIGFTNPSGETLTFRQIAYGAWKEGINVETVTAGEEYLVDGTRYSRD